MALLVDLDAPGADRADAEELCAALARCGCESIALCFHGPPTGHAAPWSGRRARDWAGAVDGSRVLASFAPTAVVALSAHGGPPSLGAARWLARPRLLTSGRDADVGVAWGVDPARAGRDRLGLWDGDYLLSPIPPARRGGGAMLRAFAAVGEDEPSLDLVILAEPDPVLLDVAAALGIAARVHFAGPAAREAEWAWLAHAAAVALAPRAPLCPGLLLRAWACGRVPVMIDGRHRWTGLDAAPLLHAAADPRALAALLGRALARAGEVPALEQQGRRLAARCGWRVLAERIARLCGAEPRGRTGAREREAA